METNKALLNTKNLLVNWLKQPVAFIKKPENRWLKVGLIGVVISLTCGATMHALAVPWLKSADEPLHLDYVWQIGQGALPEFFAGPQAPIDRHLPPVQWVYQHPPLYYLTLAPVVNPVFNQLGWKWATLAGRLATVGISVLYILVLASATWIYTNKNRLYTVAVPAIVTSLTPFIGIAAAIYNDILSILFFTLALGLCALVIKEGPKKQHLLLLGVTAIAGMATRASFVSMLGLILIAVVYSYLIHCQLPWKRRLFKGLASSALILLVTVAINGWFYIRNYALSGAWTGGQVEWAQANLNRNAKPLFSILMDPSLYLYFPRRMFDVAAGQVGMQNLAAISMAVFIFGLLGLLLTAIKNRWWGKINYVTLGLAGLLILHAAFILGQQAVHASSGGGFIFRYYLPLLLPIGLIIASGGLLVRRLRGLAIVAVVSFGWLATVNKLINLQGDLHRQNPGFPGLFAYIGSNSSVPSVVFVILSAGVIIGLSVQAVALWQLTKRGN